ncbi:hypothetical protein ACHHV8_33430 [Paenibacillus sp. TAB 01]|uniref:hypothetical protein n=1 Tax=Paenibacillus sp. TAB 01 TaxID=3368988 RepID=UPI0037517B30
METDMLSLAALITAFVGVAKSLGMSTKFSSLLALAIAAVLVLVPTEIQSKIVAISTIGLTATGAYQLSKNKTGGTP